MPLSHRRSVIVASLFIAFLLDLSPWPVEYLWLRPDFLLLVTLYWVIYQPNHLGIGTAWLLGLLLDLSDGGWLGQHALAYAVTVFVLLLVQRRMFNFPPWQQALPILVLLLIEQLICILVATFVGDTHYALAFFAAIITGTACWIPLWLLLHRLRTPSTAEAQ
ncbi:MAG: rod shape-determining protein MreD [Sulfuriferula sp.]